MHSRDPRVDAYIERAPDFARPVLTHLRKVVHSASPLIEEDIKWGVPYFTYKGLLCGMAAFKNHVAFGFWNEAALEGEETVETAMWQFGRIRSLDDLPSPDTITGFVLKAIDLNERGVKPQRRSADEVVVPQELADALDSDPRAREAFAAMTASQQREYADWIADAKRDSTREKRLATAIEWISEGKTRNWKYQ